MNNNIPSKEVIEELRKGYKPGTVVVLDKMMDIQAPEVGTAGEVLSVDDIGTVHVSWLPSGSLGVAYGEDEIHLATSHETALYRIAKESKRQKADPDAPCFCPRCGEEMGGISRHALSRRADIFICDECGVKESIEDAVAAGVMKGEAPLPIEEWAVAKGAYHIYAEEDECGWRVMVPETGAEGHCEKPEDRKLKTQDEIHEYFEKHQDEEFVRFQDGEFQFGDRVRYYHFFREILPRRIRSLWAVCLRVMDITSLMVQKAFGVNRKKGIKFQKGANWFSITDKFARYVIGQKEWIEKTFRWTTCCDEVFGAGFLFSFYTIIYTRAHARVHYYI